MNWAKIIAAVAVVGIGGAAAYPYLQTYLKKRNRTEYREVALSKGTVIQAVNSTGTVEPEKKVQVGSVVSGPIEDIFVDFNTMVKKGQLMAKIDSRTYEAAVSRDRAACASARADVARVQAEVEQARNDEARAIKLRKAKKDFISDSEMDRTKFQRMSFEAQLAVSKAQVQSAESLLRNSEANLTYTDIRAPESGIVMERKVDKGQSLAANFQTPVLFVVAPDIDKFVDVYASVDEADIGLISRAKKEKRPVTFTVDAWPEETFQGEIIQVRINPTITSSVVTYDVVVRAANPETKLLPGMTANLTFQINVHENVLRVPNTALRFYPQVDQVRPEDRDLLEGGDEDSTADKPETAPDKQKPGNASSSSGRDRRLHHLWVTDGDFLRAVPITTGITDKKYTEIVRGDLTDKDLVVTGVKAP
jgi:HlyD family secretion protein